MRLNVYCIFDVAAGAYMRPFFVQADGQAQRLFSDLALDASHDIGKHPSDYTLFRIGTYEELTGEIVGEKQVKICTALECVSASRKVDSAKVQALQEKVSNA